MRYTADNPSRGADPRPILSRRPKSRHAGFFNSLALGLAVVTLLTGWCLARLRGETTAKSLFVGGVLALFLTVELLDRLGYFDALEWSTAAMISLLADVAGQSNIQVDGSVLIKQLLADQFNCIGHWDGVLSYLGIGFFLCLKMATPVVACRFSHGSLRDGGSPPAI